MPPTRLGLALSFVLALPLAAQWQAPPAKELQQLLDDRLAHEASAGIVLGVLDHGVTRFCAAGRRGGEGSPPLDADTVFEIGSISKVFTTTLLAEMVARGEVALTDPVQQLLPKDVHVPARGERQITLLDLATASSGLPRLPELTPADPRDPYADYSAAKLYAWLGKYELPRDPGAQYEYSNLGMGLLGHALSLRLGKPYEQCVRERVLTPLGLRDTTITLSAEQQKRLAPPHGGDLEPSTNWTFDALAGAGAWRSTARDMLRWLAACLQPPAGKLGEAMRATFAVQHDTGTAGLSIALGWHVLQRGTQAIVWHNGATGGYHSFCGFVPATGACVVVLSDSATDIDDIGRHVLDAELPLRDLPVPRKTVAVGKDVLSRYAGRYEITPQFVLDVTVDGDRLFVQATGQARLRVYASSPTRFFYQAVAAEIEFTAAETGPAPKLVLFQDGREMPGRRLP